MTGPKPPSRPDPSKSEERGLAFPSVTLHGIGWFVALLVNLVTLWAVVHGGKL